MYGELNGVIVKTDVRCYRIDTLRVTRVFKDLDNEIIGMVNGVKVYRVTVGEFTDPDATEKLNSQTDTLPEEYGLITGEKFDFKGCLESDKPLILLKPTGKEITTEPVRYIKIDLTD